MVKGRVVEGFISVGIGIVVLSICDADDVSRIEHGPVQSSFPSSGSERMNIAAAGDSVELHLSGIDIAQINVGNVLSDMMKESLRPKLKRKLTARIIVMRLFKSQ